MLLQGAMPARAWTSRKRRGSGACQDKASQGKTLYALDGSVSRLWCKLDGLHPSSEACIPAQRRQESCKAASASQRGGGSGTRPQLCRATHRLVGATNERDTDVRRSAIMRQCRIAYAGGTVPSSHQYGDGVPIGPNVCLSWGAQPSKTWISQSSSSGNTDASQELRGRGTALEALRITCEDMPMLSARTGEMCRAVSEVTRLKEC